MSKLEILNELKDKALKNNIDNQENIYVNVLIRDKKFKQFCGNGQQKIRWLTDCAIYKFEISSEQKVTCGPAYGLKMEDGSLCDLNKTIASTLATGANVLVLLKEEYDVETEDKLKRKGSNTHQINLVNNFYDEPNEYGEEGENEGEEEGHNYKNEYGSNNEEEMHYLPRNGDFEDNMEDNEENEYNSNNNNEGEEQHLNNEEDQQQ